MKPSRKSEVIVLGSGPVGIVAALELSKRYRTTLVTRQLPTTNAVPTVEAVPAALVSLFVELGIHPRQIGVESLQESRLMAWEQESYIERPGPAAAHVERPALDVALLNLAVASRRVGIELSSDPQVFRVAIEAARSRRLRLIDATGRAAVSAKKKVRPAKPWAARTFLALRQTCSADRALRIAALRGGFAYRLGASHYIVLGIVGRRQTIGGTPSGLQQHLRESGAQWVLEGLPPIADMIPGRIAPASVQWTIKGVGMTIGDAALARDILASQGLSVGISEALYAAASQGDDDDALLSLRQTEQRTAHIGTLSRLIANCRFQQEKAWQEYAAFVQHADQRQPPSRIALRAGRIQV